MADKQLVSVDMIKIYRIILNQIEISLLILYFVLYIMDLNFPVGELKPILLSELGQICPGS